MVIPDRGSLERMSLARSHQELLLLLLKQLLHVEDQVLLRMLTLRRFCDRSDLGKVLLELSLWVGDALDEVKALHLDQLLIELLHAETKIVLERCFAYNRAHCRHGHRWHTSCIARSHETAVGKLTWLLREVRYTRRERHKVAHCRLACSCGRVRPVWGLLSGEHRLCCRRRGLVLV